MTASEIIVEIKWLDREEQFGVTVSPISWMLNDG